MDLPAKNCDFDWIWNMRPSTVANGSVLVPIGYAGVGHDNMIGVLDEVNVVDEVLTVNGVTYFLLDKIGSGVPDFVLLGVVIFEEVVDVDVLGKVVDISGVVVGLLVVTVILLISTSRKASGCGKAVT